MHPALRQLSQWAGGMLSPPRLPYRILRSVGVLKRCDDAEGAALSYRVLGDDGTPLDAHFDEEQIRAAPPDWPWSHKRWRLKKSLYGKG